MTTSLFKFKKIEVAGLQKSYYFLDYLLLKTNLKLPIEILFRVWTILSKVWPLFLFKIGWNWNCCVFKTFQYMKIFKENTSSMY
jgi:hypothetical protein